MNRDDTRIVAFEGGELRELKGNASGNEAVLGLPLNRLLVKMIRVPAESDADEVARAALQAANPFPDEALTVSTELVREDPRGKVMIAAALPESAAEDIGEALDAAKLSVVRIDSLAIGQLRGVWSALGASDGRRLVVFKTVDGLSIVALDGEQPSAIRAITNLDDLKREVMLSLLEAEDFGGARKLEEIVIVSSDPVVSDVPSPQVSQDPLAPQVVQSLSLFAPVRSLTVGADAALVGIAERTGDEGALNALPASWAEMLAETRFQAKLKGRVAIAVGLWLLVMGVLFGVPVGYGFMTDYQKKLSKQHARQYQAVKEMREKVELIQKYSDHARGALEIMKAISDRLPDGITITSWEFKRDEGIVLRGETDSDEDVYQLKDKLVELTVGEGDDAERLFPTVEQTYLKKSSRQIYSFELVCAYQQEEEE